VTVESSDVMRGAMQPAGKHRSLRQQTGVLASATNTPASRLGKVRFATMSKAAE
jgi:hypothetical protein